MYYKIIKRRMDNQIEETNKREILLSIVKTKMDLNNNINNFDLAEREMIDYYLYQIKANRAKLDFLIKEAKKMNLTYDEKLKYEIS